MRKEIGTIILLIIATICLPGVAHIVKADDSTDSSYGTDGASYKADLIPLDLSFQQWFDGWNAYSTVKNNGNFASSSFRSIFMLDDDVLGVDWRWLPITPGNSITQWSGQFQESGEHYLSITVDDFDLVPESNETNNFRGHTYDFD